MQSLTYQTGIGNLLASEALPGSLPQGRNSPQRCAHGLYAELLSGSAFTAPRAQNQRSWMYRRRPSVAEGTFAAYAQPRWCADTPAVAPAPWRWAPLPIPAQDHDFADGLVAYAMAGDPDAHAGMSALLYTATRSMTQRALQNADGEMLIVPQQGSLRIQTELGWLAVEPGEIALIPRGLAFRVELDGAENGHRGYVCENHGAAFRLPELGPIGSNGLANARDFLAPVAAFDREPGDWELLRKQGGRLWTSRQSHSPFNVVAWHGTLYPVKYDTRRFNTIGTVSFDHPDPSIFTVLTSPSDTPGWANVDFVIFPPRWMVAEDTFRPPWYHRNVMSEFMGLVYGQYDAKPEGFKPGGASLHNAFVPHGPDAEAFSAASQVMLAPHKLDHTLAFMFETRYRLRPTDFALNGGLLETGYAQCWAALQEAAL
ncbi:homogentisate 1,2-dioxygenase [Inhella sp.]|uniref:homogentisate 1,2-dioxygenase n=1 Tax=Inhella sp. TaxID=1921806 RepID=UPI0035B151A2